MINFCDKVESTGIILLLLSRFLRHATAEKRVKDERIEQSLTYIRENIGRRVNMDELAKVSLYLGCFFVGGKFG